MAIPIEYGFGKRKKKDVSKIITAVAGVIGAVAAIWGMIAIWPAVKDVFADRTDPSESITMEASVVTTEQSATTFDAMTTEADDNTTLETDTTTPLPSESRLARTQSIESLIENSPVRDKQTIATTTKTTQVTTSTEKRYYTISFDANGGSGAPSPIRALEGSSPSAPKEPSESKQITVNIDANGGLFSNGTSIKRESVSAEFYEWNTKADGSGNRASGFLNAVREDTTYYAIWRTSYTRLTHVGYRYPPTKSGYEFVSWYTHPTGGTKTSEVKQSFGIFSIQGNNQIYSDSVTIYAQWKLD